MIVWINGPFGGGKTTSANRVVERLDNCRLFDPEWIGYLLRDHLRDRRIDDFQDVPAWRRLVPVVAAELQATTGDTLVAVQSVLDEQYWHEIAAGIRAAGLPLLHVVLDIDEPTLRARIDRDEFELAAAGWRHDHVPAFFAARSWLVPNADLVVDTAGHEPIEVADRVAALIADRRGALSSE